MVVVTASAYVPTLRAGYLLDDSDYVTDNSMLRSTVGLWQIWVAPRSSPQYYPLTFTSFWLEYRLWGLAPAGYHVTNVVLHSLNAILLWVLLSRLRVDGAFLAAAVFAIHPVQVDSVAWVAERKTVLSGTFSMLAVLMWLRFLRTRRWQSYVSTLVLFMGAMLSKTTAGTLPLVLALLSWWQDPRKWRGDIWRIGLFFAVGAPLMAVTSWRERLYGNPELLTSYVSRVLIAGRAVWFYAWKLIWPANLMAIYPRWEVDSSLPWQYVFPLGVVVGLAVLWLIRERFGRAPFVAALSFAIILLPALGFLDFGFMVFSYVADHFQYLACVGLIALLCGAATRASQRLGPSARWLRPTVGASVLLVLGTATWQRSQVYQDAETLWRDNLAKNPGAWGARNFLGKALLDKGKLDEASEQFVASLQMNPNYADARIYWATALERQGKIEEAARQYVLALSAHQPRRQAFAHTSLGRVLTMQGKFAEALPHYAAALQIKPDDAGAHSNWGATLDKMGRLEEASVQYAAAASTNPMDASAQNNLATVLAKQGKFDEASAHFSAALRIAPENADVHFNVGLLLVRRGQTDEALQHFAEAVRVNPSHVDAHRTMGKILLTQGKLEEAIAHFADAVRLVPDSADARGDLQRALAQRHGSP